MPIFAALEVCRDINSRSAALNMAIDEALLETAHEPTIRLYRWDHPALTFGYSNRFAEMGEYCNRDCARRWTGGGIVLHGHDLTYALIIPASDPAFGESSLSIYEQTHHAIQAAIGSRAELATADAAKISEACFANPVRADVILNGQKIAGAAQRRTRAGLLQQGSIQNVDLPPRFEEKFAAQLSDRCVERQLNERLLQRAQKISEEKYGTEDWLRKR